jgi:hypothetical protein
MRSVITDVFFDHRYADLGAAEHVEISTSWQDDAFDPNDYDTERELTPSPCSPVYQPRLNLHAQTS